MKCDQCGSWIAKSTRRSEDRKLCECCIDGTINCDLEVTFPGGEGGDGDWPNATEGQLYNGEIDNMIVSYSRNCSTFTFVEVTNFFNTFGLTFSYFGTTLFLTGTPPIGSAGANYPVIMRISGCGCSFEFLTELTIIEAA